MYLGSHFCWIRNSNRIEFMQRNSFTGQSRYKISFILVVVRSGIFTTIHRLNCSKFRFSLSIFHNCNFIFCYAVDSSWCEARQFNFIFLLCQLVTHYFAMTERSLTSFTFETNLAPIMNMIRHTKHSILAILFL